MKITVTSQLMPNHVAGAPLAAQKAVALACTADGSQILFSLDEAHTFAVTLPSADSGTGWEQVNLGAQLAQVPGGGLGPAPKVQAFAVSQDPSGAIWLVVAAAADADKPSAVFVSTGLSGSSTSADWQGFAKHLSQRQIPAGLVVNQAVVGGIGGAFPMAVLVAHDAGGDMHHLQLNPQPGAGDWQCLPLQFAANTTDCRGVAVGVNDRYGPGVYAVCELVTLVNLTFTTLPRIVGGRPVSQTVVMALPNGLDPFAVAAVPAAGGRTEVYAAGQGACRWPVSAQVHSNLPGARVADAASFGGVTELVAAQDAASGHVSAWGQDKRDVLMQVNGDRKSADTVDWQLPLPVAPEVTAVAAYRAPAGQATSTAGLLLGASDGSLSLTVQDPQSTLWQRQTVNLRRREVAHTLSTYTTRVLVTDDDGQPLRDTPVNIQPTTDCAVLINGTYYALRKTVAKTANTDVSGVLTIVSETSDITAPVYTFSVGTTGTDGAGTAATVTEDPGAKAKDMLRAVKKGGDLTDAKRCNGELLFPKPPDPDAAEAAATAVSKVMEIHDALAAGHRPAVRAAGGAPLFAVHYSHGRSVLLDQAEAAGLASSSPQDLVLVTPGDLLRAMFSEAVSAFDYWVDQAWNFCVKIGETVLGFLVDLAEKAVGVVDWVLRKTLGLSLDDLISWLGFIFSWGDIRRNHTAMAKMVEMTLDWTVTGLVKVKDDVRKGFDAVRKNGLNPDLSNPVFSDKTRNAPQNDSVRPQSPEESWGSQQLSGNAGDAVAAPATLPDAEDLWSRLGKDEIAVIQQAYARLQDDLVSHYEDYTFAEMIKKFLDIVADAVLGATESALLTMLDAAALTTVTVKSLLTARWDIPVLTYVYEQIICAGDGSKLTLLDLVSLLAAVPATIGAKLVTEQNLFSDAQISAITSAKTWDQLIQGLANTPQELAGTVQRPASDPVLTAAASLEFIGMLTRAESAVYFALRELGGFDAELRDLCNRGKIATDCVTLAMLVTSTFVIEASSSRPGSVRKTIDFTVSFSSLLAVARDIYLLWFGQGHSKEETDARADFLRVVETVGGITIVVSSVVSLVLQLQEKPPDIDRDAWNTLLAMKFIQNFCSGAYYTLGFAAITTWPPDFRWKGAVVRTVILAVRWAANCIRTTMQLVYRVADFDGPL
jgi:hypothetical protein